MIVFVACTSRMGREAECINVSKVMVGISFTSDGKMEEKDLICIQPYFYSQNWGQEEAPRCVVLASSEHCTMDSSTITLRDITACLPSHVVFMHVCLLC